MLLSVFVWDTTGIGNCTLIDSGFSAAHWSVLLSTSWLTHKTTPTSSLNYTDLMTTEELEENLSRNQRLLSINGFITNSFHKLNLDNLLIHITQGNDLYGQSNKKDSWFVKQLYTHSIIVKAYFWCGRCNHALLVCFWKIGYKCNTEAHTLHLWKEHLPFKSFIFYFPK